MHAYLLRLNSQLIVFFSLLITLLPACSLMPTHLITQQQKPKLPITVSPLKLPESTINEDTFLTLTPQMQAFIDSLNLDRLSPDKKVSKIYNTLFYQNNYIIDYDMFTTLNAGDTFAKKRGNCLSLTAMMVALGRAAGLKSQFRESTTKPVWYSQNGLLAKLSHINTLMHKTNRLSVIVDFNEKSYDEKNTGIILNDQIAQAMYLNNLASEALIKNNLNIAYHYYRKALLLAPNQSDIWNNMGALLNRIKQYKLSESILKYAVKLDPKNYSVLINLQNLYHNTQQFELVSSIKKSIDTLYADNPQYIKSLAERALIAGDIQKALAYIKRANQISPNLIDPTSIYVSSQSKQYHYQLLPEKFK